MIDPTYNNTMSSYRRGSGAASPGDPGRKGANPALRKNGGEEYRTPITRSASQLIGSPSTSNGGGSSKRVVPLRACRHRGVSAALQPASVEGEGSRKTRLPARRRRKGGATALGINGGGPRKDVIPADELKAGEEGGTTALRTNGVEKRSWTSCSKGRTLSPRNSCQTTRKVANLGRIATGRSTAQPNHVVLTSLNLPYESSMEETDDYPKAKRICLKRMAAHEEGAAPPASEVEMIGASALSDVPQHGGVLSRFDVSSDVSNRTLVSQQVNTVENVIQTRSKSKAQMTSTTGLSPDTDGLVSSSNKSVLHGVIDPSSPTSVRQDALSLPTDPLSYQVEELAPSSIRERHANRSSLSNKVPPVCRGPQTRRKTAVAVGNRVPRSARVLKRAQQNIVRIGQLNLARFHTCSKELNEILPKHNLDLIAVQEPCFTANGRLQCLGAKYKILSMFKDTDRQKTAVIIKRGYAAMLLSDLSDGCRTVVQVSCRTLSFCLVSCYFPNKPGGNAQDLEEHTKKLEYVLHQLRGSRVIICADANARSSMWYSSFTDQRGTLVEDLIQSSCLRVWNEGGQPTTFSSAAGRSNIDVTMTNDSDISVLNWRVWEEESMSDHRLITFGIEPRRGPHSTVGQSNSLGEGQSVIIRTTNWAAFEESLTSQLEQTPLPTLSHATQSGIDDRIKAVESMLLIACRKSGSKPKTSTSTKFALPPYVLTCRREMYGLGRKRQRCPKEDERRSELTIKYREACRAYRRAYNDFELERYERFVKKYSGDPWGPVYRSLKHRSGTDMCSVIDPKTGVTCRDIRQNLQLVLDTLFPSDDPHGDTEGQKVLRRDATSPPSTVDGIEFTLEELMGVIGSMKGGTAPGLDGVTPEAMKHLGEPMSKVYLDIYNACLRIGYFPTQWKRARLVLLRKENVKANTPKAYRPISLLSVPSKVLEGLLIERIMCAVGPNLSDRQYGFTRGLSTVEAIRRVMSYVEESDHKIVVLISLDISGAFDNAWWPSAACYLKEHGCPRNMYTLFADFFANRQVEYRLGDVHVTKDVQRGCPQGSKAGPKCWNIILDSLLKLVQHPNIELVSYADDTAVLVKANSRREIERMSTEVLNTIAQWGIEHKLMFNPGKTEAILLKDSLCRKRNPCIKMMGSFIKFTQKLKYLGVILSKSFGFEPHMTYVTRRARVRVNLLQKLARPKFGVSSGVLKVLYKGAFEPAVTYASPVFADRLNSKTRRLLLSSQRCALIPMLRAYRTVPGDALPVLAGVLPMDLLVQYRAASYKRLKSEELMEPFIQAWSDRWTNSDKGRAVYEYVPDVTFFMRDGAPMLTRPVVQFITEHGCSKAYGRRFHPDKNPNARCTCGAAKQTFDHLLVVCPDFEEERSALKSRCQDLGLGWPCKRSMLLENSDLYELFAAFCSEVCIMIDKTHNALSTDSV